MLRGSDVDNLYTLGNQVLNYGQECPECVFNFYINLDNYVHKNNINMQLKIDQEKLDTFIQNI